MRDDDINLKMKVDPNLKDDTVLQMGDNQVTYGELKDMYKVVNQEPIRCLIYWDDVCQYTSLGLIEVINALFKTDAKIDFEHFFTRLNDYIYGIEYVYKILLLDYVQSDSPSSFSFLCELLVLVHLMFVELEVLPLVPLSSYSLLFL